MPFLSRWSETVNAFAWDVLSSTSLKGREAFARALLCSACLLGVPLCVGAGCLIGVDGAEPDEEISTLRGNRSSSPLSLSFVFGVLEYCCARELIGK